MVSIAVIKHHLVYSKLAMAMKWDCVSKRKKKLLAAIFLVIYIDEWYVFACSSEPARFAFLEQDHLFMSGTAYIKLGCPHQSSRKKMLPHIFTQAIWWGHFLSWHSLFQNHSRSCQGDKTTQHNDWAKLYSNIVCQGVVWKNCLLSSSLQACNSLAQEQIAKDLRTEASETLGRSHDLKIVGVEVCTRDIATCYAVDKVRVRVWGHQLCPGQSPHSRPIHTPQRQLNSQVLQYNHAHRWDTLPPQYLAQLGFPQSWAEVNHIHPALPETYLSSPQLCLRQSHATDWFPHPETSWLPGSASQPGSQAHRMDKIHSETSRAVNTWDNQMVRGNHKNISNRNQCPLAPS